MHHTTIITCFPEMFPGSLAYSIAGKALGGAWSFDTVDLKHFVTGKFGRIDDAPFGGGAGMVMRADVLGGAIDSVTRNGRQLYYLSPRGKPFNQQMAMEMADTSGIIMLCGRYEGIDQRVIDYYQIQEISIGDYILSGGELGAMVIMDAIIRLLPSVMGNHDSNAEESFNNNLLEYPQYTRPAIWNDLSVPNVLRSGDHGAINLWRKDRAMELTKSKRPDLWDLYTKAK